MLLCLLRVYHYLLLYYLRLLGRSCCCSGCRLAVQRSSYRYITTVTRLSVWRIELFAISPYITLRLRYLYHLRLLHSIRYYGHRLPLTYGVTYILGLSYHVAVIRQRGSNRYIATVTRLSVWRIECHPTSLRGSRS